MPHEVQTQISASVGLTVISTPVTGVIIAGLIGVMPGLLRLELHVQNQTLGPLRLSFM